MPRFKDKLKDQKLIAAALHSMIAADGRARICGVWVRPPESATASQIYESQFQGNLEQKHAKLGGQLLTDIAVSGAGTSQTVGERARANLESADKKLKSKPDDVDVRIARALANFRLGENQKALDDFQFVIARFPEFLPAKQYRIITLIRLGKKEEAQSELTKFQKEDAPESAKLHVATVLAAESGAGIDKTTEAMEAAIKKRPSDADLRYDAARAFSLASRAISRSDKAKGRQLAQRSLQLLREAAENDDAALGEMDEDGDLDPIRDDPEFAEIMNAGHPDRRYGAVWNSDGVRFESTPVFGIDPNAHLQKCRELITQGYRPVSLSAARTTPGGQPAAASAWQRPRVQEDVKDRLAERQARAAIALARLGKADEIWPLLRHSPDPRLRSFILNWLSPLGVDPGMVAAEFARPGSRASDSPLATHHSPLTNDHSPLTTHHSPLTHQQMDAILFHPETSLRRALILALGTFSAPGLSAGEREPLAAKLLDLYRDDPDCGIHGAAEWTLRKWGQQDKLKELDAQLMKQKAWGDRRWYVNGQGQTFAVIEGPLEFQMGSPPTDTERIADIEPPERIVIPRRFAVAAKEVTVEQFQRFMNLANISVDRYGMAPSQLSRYSPNPDGAWVSPDWFVAAHYCNWLSEQEGFPKDQWCYLPNEAGAYADGMTIPVDVLERTGYRLPTGAEWEFACRAGAVTSRYFGHSIELLNAYAWFRSNSNERAWTCGSLLPNDLGLFDMLGNTSEWNQESLNGAASGKKRPLSDVIRMSETITRKYPSMFGRLLRGGSHSARPSNVRAADHGGNAASFRNLTNGFRPVRTLRSGTPRELGAVSHQGSEPT
jgi:formylglycine-generating enzyme required for sulfatase activity/tetratricopeptide (TPR) repeat protein